MASRSKDREEAERFRAAVQQLRSLGEIFRDWEADWLDSQARRPPGYISSDKERIILNQIRAAARSFEGYGGISVPDLISMAYRYRADFDEDSDKFVELLKREGVSTLAVRQLSRLVGLARVHEDIPRDELVEEAMAETRARDDGLHEPPAFIPYQRAS